MDRSLDPIRRHPIMSYVVLATALSWAVWIPMALRGEIVTRGGPISHFAGLLGPLLAAVMVTAIVDGRAGLLAFGRRLARWRVPVRWYVMAALPLAMMLGALALIAMTGGELPPPGAFVEYSGLPELAFPLLLAVVVLVGGYGEEAGWRGYLTPQLLKRRGPFVTSLLVAAAWFAWHAPLFQVVDTYRTMGLAVIPMLGIGLVSGAIVLTWIYVGSGGSVFVAALFHSALNLTSATAAGSGLAGIVVWNGVLIWAILVSVGWMLAPVSSSRPLAQRLRDGFMVAVLRSPLGRFFGGMTVVTFRGRRSGRTMMTPVECVVDHDRLVVFVGHPAAKQWWRNVAANPDVEVEIAGTEVAGRATVHAPGERKADRDGAAAGDLATYLTHRPRLRRILGVEEGSLDAGDLARLATQVVTVRIDLAGAA